MKMFRCSTLVFLITAVTLIFVMPFMAFADPVSWSSQMYTASTSVELWEVDAYGNVLGLLMSDYDSQTGPPLPVYSSATASLGLTATATSEITGSTMINNAFNVNYPGCCVQRYGYATASFTGNFTANTSFLQFTYDYVGSDLGWFEVNDLSNGGANLLNVNLNPGNADTFYVPLTLGHDVEVKFGINNNNSNGSLTFLTATVVPEPVNAILFVTGGTLLMGRRLLRRKERTRT